MTGVTTLHASLAIIMDCTLGRWRAVQEGDTQRLSIGFRSVFSSRGVDDCWDNVLWTISRPRQRSDPVDICGRRNIYFYIRSDGVGTLRSGSSLLGVRHYYVECVCLDGVEADFMSLDFL
jgi:hypothetical protein